MHYVAVLVILIVAYVVWAKLIRRREPEGQDWEGIAKELGFSYFAGTARQFPVMRGDFHRLEVRISSEKSESSKGRSNITRVVVFLGFPTLDGLFIAQHGMLGALERIFAIEHIEIGEMEVDDRLLIKGTREEEVVQLLSDVPLRRALLDLFDKYPTAQVSSATVSVSLSEVVRDSRRLHAVLQDLASTIEYLETALACEETERISEGRRSSTPPPMPDIQFAPTELPTIFDNDMDLKGEISQAEDDEDEEDESPVEPSEGSADDDDEEDENLDFSV